MIKVVKFGGSSLASAEQFAKVGKIIQADKERRYVVPSAPGKRNAKDTKVTDMLYACYALVEAEEDFRVPLMKIKDRYDTIINGLNLKLSLEEEFKKISENFKNKAGVDYAASRGEYLNGIIMDTEFSPEWKQYLDKHNIRYYYGELPWLRVCGCGRGDFLRGGRNF